MKLGEELFRVEDLDLWVAWFGFDLLELYEVLHKVAETDVCGTEPMDHSVDESDTL